METRKAVPAVAHQRARSLLLAAAILRVQAEMPRVARREVAVAEGLRALTVVAGLLVCVLPILRRIRRTAESAGKFAGTSCGTDVTMLVARTAPVSTASATASASPTGSRRALRTARALGSNACGKAADRALTVRGRRRMNVRSLRRALATLLVRATLQSPMEHKTRGRSAAVAPMTPRNPTTTPIR